MKKIIFISLLTLTCSSQMPAQELFTETRFSPSIVLLQDSILTIASIGSPVFAHYQDSILVTSEPYFLFFFGQEDTTTFLPALDQIEGIRIYPNPTHDRLMLEKEGVPYAMQIELFDTKGILVYTYQWPEQLGSIQPNLSLLASGIYYVRVTNQERTLGNTYKILKQ